MLVLYNLNQAYTSFLSYLVILPHLSLQITILTVTVVFSQLERNQLVAK